MWPRQTLPRGLCWRDCPPSGLEFPGSLRWAACKTCTSSPEAAGRHELRILVLARAMWGRDRHALQLWRRHWGSFTQLV